MSPSPSPMIQQIRKRLKALALLDAVIEPEWEYRYFSFDANWSASTEMASLRDGSGGEWFLWLSGGRAGYKCMSPGDGVMGNIETVKKSVPIEFKEFISEPAFSMNQATCIWYCVESEWIRYGLTVNEIFGVEVVLSWEPKDYRAWAVEYYEREIDIGAVQAVFQERYSEEIAKKLNPGIDLDLLEADLVQIQPSS